MFYYTEFNGVDLAPYNPITPASTRPLISPKARMADGRAFYRLGEREAEQGAGVLTYTGTIYDELPHKVEAAYYALQEQVGQTGWLVRKWEGTTLYQRIFAACEGVRYSHTPDWRGRLVSRVEMDFYLQDPSWNGMIHGDYEPAFDQMKYVFADRPSYPTVINSARSTTVTSGSSTTIDLYNGGNAIVRGVLIKAYAGGGATLTGGFYISYDANTQAGSPYYHIKHTSDVGAALAAQTLIDTRAKAVTDNSISPIGKISNFEYGGSHNSEHWLGLHRGANTITIGTNSGTFPAGGVTFEFHYCEAHK